MKQILQSFKTGELWLSEVPTPLCKKNGILMRNHASFVSAGTERMLVDFARKSIVGKALQMPDQVRKVIRKMRTEGIFTTLEKVQAKLDQPIPLGYSCAGVVMEAGDRADGLAIGDRVACGGAGFANHAEFNYVPRNLAVKLPDNVSFEDASCATVGSIAMQGVRQCELHLGESVCMIGLGLLGMLALQMCKASGCRVIGFDPNPERCKLALEQGADMVVSEGLEEAALAFSLGHGVDAVLITAATHSSEPVTVAAEIARMKGKVVATGLVGMNIPRDQYYKKELDFRLSLSYGPGRYDPIYEEGGIDYPFGYVRWTEQRNMQAFIDLVSMDKIQPSKLITHRFDFDNALDAYALLLGKIAEPYLGIMLNYPGAEKHRPEKRIEICSRSFSPGAEPAVSFIGCGNFTKAVLLPNLKKLSGIHLRGLCTASGMNCGETAKKEKFEFAATSQEEILNDTAADLIFITTRHDSHAPLVKAGLEAHKNIFVEKPLAINEEQLQEVENAVKGSNGRLMVGFNRRFSPHAKLLKEYFAKRSTPLLMTYRVNAGAIPRNIWLQDPEIGGGRLIGEGCHFIDFMSYVADAPVVSVQGRSIQTANSALVAEDSVSLIFTFADGSIGTLLYAALGDPVLPKERCEIHGENSTAVMDDFCTTVCSGKLGRKKLSGKQQKGFVGELSATLEAIRNGTPAPIPAESLFNVTRATFAALRALKTGQNEMVG